MTFQSAEEVFGFLKRYHVFLPSSVSQELISLPCSFQSLCEYANPTLCLLHKQLVYEDSFSLLARAWLHFCSHTHPHHAERIQSQSILIAYLVFTVTEWSHYEFSHSWECHRYFRRSSVVIGKYLSSSLASESDGPNKEDLKVGYRLFIFNLGFTVRGKNKAIGK